MVPTVAFPPGMLLTLQVTAVFAEPVTVEIQQNFRVEMLFPQGVPGDPGVPGLLANAGPPLRLWTILDGYLTRDVQ